MHASGHRRLLNGPFGRPVRVLCRLAGINPRRCFCIRCLAVRTGIFRRTRTWVGHRAYADVHLLGIRIRHRFAFAEAGPPTPSAAAAGPRPTL